MVDHLKMAALLPPGMIQPLMHLNWYVPLFGFHSSCDEFLVGGLVSLLVRPSNGGRQKCLWKEGEEERDADEPKAKP